MAAIVASSKPSPVTDQSDAIVQLLALAEQDKKGQVAAADRLEVLLRERGLLYESRIAPRMVGFDPCNRNGEGGNPLNVLALASEIAACGWSGAEVNKAICCEVVPQDASIEQFNRKLSTDSGMAPSRRTPSSTEVSLAAIRTMCSVASLPRCRPYASTSPRTAVCPSPSSPNVIR
jgi:hypothetical protein